MTILFGSLALLTALFSQRLAFFWGVFWARALSYPAFVRVRVEGRSGLPAGQSAVLVANHEGYFDILALYGFLGRPFRWVMKAELRKVPFLGWACAAIGHFFVDRKDPRKAVASLELARQRLPAGTSIVFFPEGTRNRDGKLLPFKRGAFVLAEALGLPVVPVAILGSARVLPTGCFLPRPGTITLRIGCPLDGDGTGGASRLAEAARQQLEQLLGQGSSRPE